MLFTFLHAKSFFFQVKIQCKWKVWNEWERQHEQDSRWQNQINFCLFFFCYHYSALVLYVYVLSFGCRFSISNQNKCQLRQIDCRCHSRHLLTQIIGWINTDLRWKNGTHKTIKKNMEKKIGFFSPV